MATKIRREILMRINKGRTFQVTQTPREHSGAMIIKQGISPKTANKEKTEVDKTWEEPLHQGTDPVPVNR